MRIPLIPAALLLASACTPSLPAAHATLGELDITEAFAREPVIQESGAAYFRVHNRGGEADTLLAVSSPEAASAMLHGSAMGHLMVLPIPPGGDATLEPGKSHLMLENLTFMPKPGDSLTLVLEFARAGRLTLRVPVRALTQ